MTGTVKVLNKYHGPEVGGTDVYIGRGSVFGNPFPINKHNSRDVVCDRYEKLVRKEWHEATIGLAVSKRTEAIRALAKRVKAGEDINLICFCKPKRCHGDFIKDVIDWYATK